MLVALRVTKRATNDEALKSIHQILVQESQNFISSIPPTNTGMRPKTARLQNMLNCRAQSKGLAGGESQSYWSNTTCSPSPSPDIAQDASTRICAHLAGKRIVFVGPLTTYHLHNLWLEALEAHDGHPFNCPGPEFCIFHHICYPGRNGSSYLDGDKQRFPKNQELRDTQSAVLQYVLSSSLVANRNKNDYLYTRPVMDPRTNMRMRNYYWLRKARKANVLILSQAPVPAPPTTYAQYRAGEWKPCLSRLLPNFWTAPTLKEDIVSLALNVTFSVFLPSVRDVIHAIQMDNQIRNTLTIWHGHWPLEPRCTNAGLPQHLPRLEQFWTSKRDRVDPWTFYYNIQIHIQDYILPRILPHFDVLYLPISVPPGEPEVIPALDPYARKDCARNARENLESAFFSSLFEILNTERLS
ncbi:hypothetical protein FA13DRAFT_1726532 [Coprinellus micaceus]|uniref:Uncharacterized protein n=1 Tax=Coprinellus micaceus TaxID=71717 RepID=A0A4Y7TTC9_COPMI|nr:hypothetical protein FA13DRAFT_1726532 [Coprinellus micaceus]